MPTTPLVPIFYSPFKEMSKFTELRWGEGGWGVVKRRKEGGGDEKGREEEEEHDG